MLRQAVTSGQTPNTAYIFAAICLLLAEVAVESYIGTWLLTEAPAGVGWAVAATATAGIVLLGDMRTVPRIVGYALAAHSIWRTSR